MQTTSGTSETGAAREAPKTPKGLDLAADLIKQIITLSTAVTAFTATFAKNFSPSGEALSVSTPLKYSWIFFVVAIFFGVVTLMTLVGAANRIEAGEQSLGANARNVRVFGSLTMIAFFVALALTIAAGFLMIG